MLMRDALTPKQGKDAEPCGVGALTMIIQERSARRGLARSVPDRGIAISAPVRKKENRKEVK
jgi:hypothetical protein